jgi:hypothetical protein
MNHHIYQQTTVEIESEIRGYSDISLNSGYREDGLKKLKNNQEELGSISLKTFSHPF